MLSRIADGLPDELVDRRLLWQPCFPSANGHSKPSLHTTRSSAFLSAHAATGCLPSGPPRCWGYPVKKVMPWSKQCRGFPTGQGMIKPCCSIYRTSYLNAAAKLFEEPHPLLSRDARKTHASKS